MSSAASSGPSGAMLQAALGGLLCFAACGDPDASSSGGGDATSGGTTASSTASTGVASVAVGSTSGGGTSESSTSGGGTSESGSGGSGGSGDGGATASSASASASGASASSSDASASSSTGVNPHTPIPNTACDGGQVPDPMVTSTEVVVLTQDEFATICSDAGGIFEIQPLCGGSNACRGIAYDSGVHVLTEHTCQATNTCAGYNCVVCSG